MSVKNVDLSNKINEVKKNIKENLDNDTNNILTTDNNTVSSGQEFKPVQNPQSNLPNVIGVKTTMLGVLGIFRHFGFYCYNFINHNFWYFYCI